MRMEDERILKKVLHGKFHNTRPVCKPRIRWENVVWMDTSQILGKRWWRRAEEREECSVFRGRPGPRRAVAPQMEQNGSKLKFRTQLGLFLL